MSSKHKKSSRSRRSNYYPTGWSEWVWSEEHQRVARYRKVTEDGWEWDFADPPETERVPPSTSIDRSTLPPASLPAVDGSDPSEYYAHDEGLADITQRLGGTTIASYAAGQQYSAGQQYQAGGYGQEYFESSRTDSGNSKDTETKCPECSMIFPRSIELERHHKTVHLNNGVRPYECLDSGCPANVRSWTTMRGLRLHERNWHGPHSCSVPGCSRQHPYGFSSEADLEEHEVEHSGDLQPDKGRDEYGRKGKGSSYKGADSSFVNQSYPPVDNSRLPRIRTEDPRRNYDSMDRRFKVHHSRDFQFGRVFKVLWSEPVGSGGTVITMDGVHGEKAFHKVRRFVITSTVNRGHSICLPILTYGFQGVLKPGVHPEDHAVVFSSKNSGPYLLEREEGLMTKQPIRIEMTSESHKLDPLSRLNYAKLYTIEHNVKVVFIGQVAKKFERAFMVAYNEAHPPFDPGPVPYMPNDDEFELVGMAEQDAPQYSVEAMSTSTTTSYRSSQSYAEPSYVSTDATAYTGTPSSSQTAQAPKYSAYDDAYDA